MSDPPAAPPPPPPPPAPGYVPPGQLPPGIHPTARPGTGNLLYQFTGYAALSIVVGLATVVVPFVFDRVFFFLPIIGLIAGVQAIRGGRMIGGVIGIVLSVIGGIITLIALFA